MLKTKEQECEELKKQLEQHYSVVALEVNRDDFKYFHDKRMYSTTNSEIGNMIAKYNDKDVILIDVNDSTQALDLCHEVLYLVEPSVIKLNRLMLARPKTFKELKDHKLLVHKFLLERFLYCFSFRKTKIIQGDDTTMMKRDHKHLFYFAHSYHTEQEILRRMFDKKGFL